MIATVRRLHSPDINNLATWSPPDPSGFGFLLQIMVGPVGQEGEESFDVQVCTPAWLEQRYGLDSIVVGRHHLIVFKYEYKAIEAFIKEYVARCSGNTWHDVAMKVGRLGRWEFEDYNEQPSGPA